ncbi:MAG: integrase arm-type DNA-binding domain-containing protein [Methylobacterium sp.]|uniref:tyrosine-type recombinase/integrase n=1 Tax=Methylobacterium sp. TaxID=409 RepID=UPI00258FD402|nr:site-specific integrase [Methylobacterium sp.]MBY0295617.1 integrase arm-type DNA-binding domain-containing protein [Methylobacterium sp.]
MPKALTVRGIEALKGGPNRVEIPDGLISGLYLVCQPSGAKSWAVRYRAGSRPRKYTLGRYPGIDLANARELARQALVAVASGRDPAAERSEAQRAGGEGLRADRDRFDRAAALFIERYAKANTKEETWRESERLLAKNVLPHWRARRVQDIAKRDVIELLDTIVDRGAPVGANRTLAVIRRMFGWLVERSVLVSNPCTGVKAPTAEKSRDRVLSDDELRAIWLASDRLSEPFGALVKLLMLTAQRRDEVGQMTWREVDLDARIWTIPKERSKNGIAHDVPLSDPAVAVLAGIRRIAGSRQLVLTTTGETPVSGFSKIKTRLDAALPDAPPWVLHDLRRTAASGMARLGINLPVIEKVLNHTSGSFGGIVGVYQRHSFADEKRAALEAWGAHVTGLASNTSKEIPE